VDNKEIIRIDELLYEIYKAEKSIHKDLKLSFDLTEIPEDSDELTVLANPDLFFIAFSNIISNAFKYGNGTQVGVAISSDSKNITIKVFDQGIGIPKKDQPHIFTSFYRASNVGDIYGNGLGLVLAKISLTFMVLNCSSIQRKVKALWSLLQSQKLLSNFILISSLFHF
jgi:signal transduction histidine kinase